MSGVALQIRGIAEYLPERCVPAEEVDDLVGATRGWTARHTGVLHRRWVTGESGIDLAERAARAALENAQLELGDIDLLLCASATHDQPLPCMAALIHRRLGMRRTPAFDVDSTCLSFVTALEVAAGFIASGARRNVLIVSTEVGSVGLNPREKESFALIGDGAAAVVVTATPDGQASRLLVADMETYSEGADAACIVGGGTQLPGWLANEENADSFRFHMEGRRLMELTMRHMPDFLHRLAARGSARLSDVRRIIPHQASLPGLRIMINRLGVPSDRFEVTVAETGNLIAASIPLALNRAIRSGSVRRGDLVMLAGTSAGVSLGGALLIY